MKKLQRGKDRVNLKQSLFAVVFISGSLGLAFTSQAGMGSHRHTSALQADSQQVDNNRTSARAEMNQRFELQTDRYPTKIEDDQSLAPGVPGVTEENNTAMSREDTIAVEEALAASGFDPGVVDGFVDNDTRTAIREFQKDNDLVITGTVDKNTAQLLGIASSESSS
jgi:hypothetical protein